MNASPWKHGCNAVITVYVPRGYDYVARQAQCGSTAYDGGINQCAACATAHPMPPAREDENDLDYDDRTSGDW